MIPFGMASVAIGSSNSKRNLINNFIHNSVSDFNEIKKLSYLYLNATSLDNKLNEFKVVIEQYKPNVISVTETWFKSDSVVNIEGHHLYSKDRSDGRKGGGVCLYIDNSLDSYELNDAVLNPCKLEQVWAVVYFDNDKYLLGCIYRPNDFLDMAEFGVVFGLARKYIDKNKFKDLLIMGDFNFPSINWSNGCVDAISNENGIEYKFTDILNDYFLYQHINIPTFQLSDEQLGSTLDLIFTTQSVSVNEIDSKFVLGNITRGHLIICFSFILSNKAIRVNKSKQIFMFANSNFELISVIIIVNLYLI